MKLIDKAAVAEIKDLYEDIDKCVGNLVLARSKHDQRGISDAHWKMETLMVNTQQVLNYILQHLEVKEVDLEKLGEIARHLMAVKEHTEDMRLDKEEWFMLEKIGYPERFKAQKGE